MGTPEIFLEHRKGEKLPKYLRVKPERELFIIGLSRDADLRLSGEGIAGCHAALRYRAPHWYVCDISGTESVKVNDQVIAEAKIDGSAKIEIAGHRFQLLTKEKDTELFKDGTAEKDLALHQVVIRSRGRILQTKILPATESFSFADGEVVQTLPPPTSGAWVKTEIGPRLIQQRLVAAQEIALAEGIAFDRDLRKPLAIALALLLMVFTSIWTLAPRNDKKTEVALDKKSMDIIFNAKAVKKKKLESQKVVKSARARSQSGSQQAPAHTVAQTTAPEESTAPKVSEKAAAALTSLRKSGLSALVGKIAKRASKQGILVASVGVLPDTQGAGRAFYSTGTTTTGGGGEAAKAGSSFRLGGVATKGKGGGVGNFKEGTGLIGGSIGTGHIVALIDEETVIEGGLDRDAIAEVIRRNLGQIRYCYERQLSSNPDLYGKVLVKFSIGAAGEVSNPRVDTTTLKSSMVEGCILRRLASWKFPEPKGGTQVNVSYPFLFKATE